MSELLTNLERLSPIHRAAGDDTLWQGAKRTGER
jgi:type IV secretory pathway TrbD component